MPILSLKIANVWTPTLELTTEELQSMATKPLKWLRYIGWCIYGASGSLSTEPGGPPIDSTAEESTNDFAAEYYYIVEGPPCYLDIALLRDYSETDAEDRFYEPIYERDGGTISPNEHRDRFLQAAHIIPFCKGDELPNKYMDVSDAPVGPAERADWPPPNSDEKEYTVDNEEKSAESACVQDSDSGYIPFTPSSRLVLQHLREPVHYLKPVLPNNLRAALRPWTRLSPVALHASYGCAIVNQFGVAKPFKGEEEDRPRKRQKTEKRATAAMDNAWDFLLDIHRPPPDVVQKQEEKRKATIQDWSARVE
ncbi:hypothetical protein FB45DRAFT_1089106 [Roridomyces roridus]|uniref:HNH nuclease domain-containing protein n=1 Tax=Roridomyces roridus TaxID=1738132 RepID=A0AAD7BKG6_9AGAR|nr:hypothetical protein FB45DRAFT_1089106 [Roridomyces roridus]